MDGCHDAMFSFEAKMTRQCICLIVHIIAITVVAEGGVDTLLSFTFSSFPCCSLISLLFSHFQIKERKKQAKKEGKEPDIEEENDPEKASLETCDRNM